MIDNDHEGLMDGRAEQKMQLLTDEIESLWENLDGKFPEENASFEKSTMDNNFQDAQIKAYQGKAFNGTC